MIDAKTLETGRVVAGRILTHWGLTDAQQRIVLPDTATDDELATRISYLLNIYKALRILFNNPDNYNGYIKMVNYNEPFLGQPPEVLLLSGQLSDIEKLYQYIDALIIW